ncbi:MAG: ribbon-helix-helix protein, CopG family [Actinomycetota bacterium]
MIRTQIQLTEAQAEKLQQLAKERRVSMASLIRQAVDETIARELAPSDLEKRRRALEVAGAFRSGLHDLGTRHDEHLNKAYE